MDWGQARRPPSAADARRGSDRGPRPATAPPHRVIEGAGNRAIASLLRPLPVQREAPPAGPNDVAGPKDEAGPKDTPAKVPPEARPTLRRGSTGDDVRFVQIALTAQGWPVSVDGQFDVQTAAYVCLLQHRWHIDVDGMVGRDTWAALDAELEPGGTQADSSAVADAAAAAAAAAGGPGPSVETATSAAAKAAQSNLPAVQRQEAGNAGGGSGGGRPAPSIETVGPGSVGSDVIMVQLGLQMRFHTAGIAVDGVFGDATEAYVLLYQHDHGLAVDGSVGPETRVRLDPVMSIQRHVAASEELASISQDMQSMSQDQLASAMPRLAPRILAAVRTLGENDF